MTARTQPRRFGSAWASCAPPACCWTALACCWTALACSGTPVAADGVRADPQAVRHALEAALARLDPAEPLRLRYNPAPCDCPPFELWTDAGWVRAELGGDAERLALWTAHVAHLAGTGPLRAELRGKLDKEPLRTLAGAYGVRIDVKDWVAPPLPAPPAPLPELPPADEPPAQPADEPPALPADKPTPPADDWPVKAPKS